jgi:hypothetical protein
MRWLLASLPQKRTLFPVKFVGQVPANNVFDSIQTNIKYLNVNRFEDEVD